MTRHDDEATLRSMNGVAEARTGRYDDHAMWAVLRLTPEAPGQSRDAWRARARAQGVELAALEITDEPVASFEVRAGVPPREERAADLVVARVTTADIIPLRHRVLRRDLPLDLSYFAGDDDADTVHVALVLDGWARCCVTLMLSTWEGEPAWQLRGMATDDGLRGQGLGARLVPAALAMLPDDGPDRLWCNAREVAIPFYARLGWEVVSDRFEIPLAGPHVRMCARRSVGGAGA